MNKATSMLVACMMLSFIFASTVWAQDVTKIRDARGMDGEEVTIQGVMNTPDYGFNNGQFYVQDSTGGINIFYSGVGGSQNMDSPDYTGWSMGDTLEIVGTIGAFNDQVQIAPSSVTVLGSGTTRPAPVVVGADGLDVESEYQGMIVKIEDVSLADGATWPADAQDGSGVSFDVTAGDSTFQIFIDRDESYYDGAPAPTERFNLTGVMGRFQENVSFLPFDSTDVQNIVSVTFMVNTSTMPDTLQEDHYVGVFGGVYSPNGLGGDYIGQTVDWSSATDIVTENQGGDYWSVTFDMAAGDGMNFKYWAGVDGDTPLINGSEQGWESGGNRNFELPISQSTDTVNTLDWYETREAPFESSEDSVTVYFRVNVGFQVQDESFNPDTDQIGVRGNPAFFDNPSDWGSSAFFLEQDAVNGDNYFYSGSTKVHKDSVANFTDDMAYKFVIEQESGTVLWEDRGDRFFSVPAQDSTLHWVYFSDDPPSDAKIINTNLNFEVNVGILEGLGYFNSAIDTVAVTGTFNGWANLNDRMSFNSFSGTYESEPIPLTAAVDAEVAYKYYIRWDASRDDEDSENYFPLISATIDGWEEPGVTGGGNRSFTIQDAENQPTQSEFFNSVPPEGLITENNTEGGALTVTFRVDMEPATSTDLARPFDPANDSVFISVETPFFALTNDLPTYSDDIATRPMELLERMMFHDDDGDMIYELDFELTMPTLNHFGFNIVFGEPTALDGEIVSAGPGGTQPGRRYYQYVTPNVAQDGDDYIISWPSTFTFPVLEWEPSEDLPFELPPDYTEVNVSNEVKGDNPNQFSLSQNYPNPFNPTTNINFELAQAVDVNLTVYNLLGQKVKTLISNKTMGSGTHVVAFDASSLSSGVYFYRLEAGDFVANKRMTLIK